MAALTLIHLGMLSLAMGFQGPALRTLTNTAVNTDVMPFAEQLAAPIMHYRRSSMLMMAPRAKSKSAKTNKPKGYQPEKPWSKAQGVALYAFAYGLLGALIMYRQANPVGGLPGVE